MRWIFPLAALLLIPVRSAGAEDISLWPFFVFHRDEERFELDVLWPAFQMEREGDERSRVHVLWPLTGFIRDGEERHRWILPSFFWGQTAPDRRYRVLFPLAGSHPDRGIHWLGNFMLRDDGRNRLWALWPLWFEQGEHRWSGGLPPLVWNVVDNHLDSISLFPLAWWDDREHWGLFPLLWRDGDWLASFPLVGRNLGGQGNCFFLFPLYAHTSDIEIETEHILWPLIALGVETYGHRWRIWPLIGMRRHVWAHGRVPRRRTTYLLWPLLWRHRDWDRHGQLMHSHIVGAPFFFDFRHRYYDDMAWRRTGVIPPLLTWWSGVEGDGGHRGIAFPLFFQSWDEEGAMSWRVLWEVARGERADGSSEFRLLRRAFRHTRQGSRRTVEIFPLMFWSGDREANEAEFSFLWRFAQWQRRGPERTLWLLGWPIRWGD
jgi:hypothetical protein